MSKSTFLERGLRGTVQDLWHQWRKGDPEAPFRKFARQRWPRRRAAGPLLLIHQSAWYPTIIGYAFIANIVAEHFGARLGSFHFKQNKVSKVAPLYEAFGAPTVLSPREEKKHEARARQLGGEIFAGLKGRRDVLNINLDDINLGDLIYDTYLRYYLVPTVQIDDPRLREMIERVLAIYFACQEFLAQNEVVTVFVDHAVYCEGGVLARLALRKGIPVYHVPYHPATLVPLDPLMYHGVPGDPTGRLTGYGSCKLTLPYHLFPALFARLTPEEQERAILKGRADLQGRLSGAYDPNVLPGGSAFATVEQTGERLMAAGDRPRILILLHDFCDAPHAFRDHLFEDNYQWAVWMLERASETPFDWYVKPHPNAAHDPEMGRKNEEVLVELRARFPKITFLSPAVSNLKLVGEGLTAMFTGYGTAGHEFAYLGVPVVNAGDNPHINYEFNLHARSIPQLERFIETATELQVKIDKRRIEEYAYMRYVYYFDRERHPASIFPDSYVPSMEMQRKLGQPEALQMAFDEPDAVEQRLRAYLHDYFAQRQNVLRPDELPAG